MIIQISSAEAFLYDPQKIEASRKIQVLLNILVLYSRSLQFFLDRIQYVVEPSILLYVGQYI